MSKRQLVDLNGVLMHRDCSYLPACDVCGETRMYAGSVGQAIHRNKPPIGITSQLSNSYSTLSVRYGSNTARARGREAPEGECCV